tara:strand:- start:2757 stop:3446 length:690 start_codon:yes stop_codon:yes gene_type:complete
MIHIINAAGGSEEVDSIQYEGSPNERDKNYMAKEHPLVTIDWREILPPPPKNSSEITRLELKEVERVTRNLTQEQFDIVMEVDKEPVNAFMPYLKRNNIEFPKELVDLALENVYPVWLKLKYLHRRARPFQVAPHLGFVISVIQTSTHQTPAYPSGHQTEGALYAEILSDIYPEHKTGFYEAAAMVGTARMLQGVHYPSDNEAAMRVARICWENIKENLDDKWTDTIKG